MWSESGWGGVTVGVLGWGWGGVEGGITVGEHFGTGAVTRVGGCGRGQSGAGPGARRGGASMWAHAGRGLSEGRG